MQTMKPKRKRNKSWGTETKRDVKQKQNYERYKQVHNTSLL